MNEPTNEGQEARLERVVGAGRNPLLVPGTMHCARCKFVLHRTNLYVGDGTTGPGTNETEPCPNGCGPLWPMTWEHYARDAAATSERFFDEAQRYKAALEKIAKYPSTPGDEIGYAGCRRIARDALSPNAELSRVAATEQNHE